MINYNEILSAPQVEELLTCMAGLTT